MTQIEFDELFNHAVKEMMMVLASKGKDYSEHGDKLSNFKENAKRLHLKPLQVWAVYFMKHVDAILNFTKSGVAHSEPIKGRFVDALNYLILGLGLLQEEYVEKSSTTKVDGIINSIGAMPSGQWISTKI